MAHTRHEIPTHLNIEDRAFYGLAARQVLCLIAGTSSGYALFNQVPGWPLSIRIGLGSACLLAAIALALIRPCGRGLEVWAFVILHYLAMPKICTWRPVEPDLAAWRSTEAGWIELTPGLSWQPLQNEEIDDNDGRSEEHT